MQQSLKAQSQSLEAKEYFLSLPNLEILHVICMCNISPHIDLCITSFLVVFDVHCAIGDAVFFSRCSPKLICLMFFFALVDLVAGLLALRVSLKKG